MSIACHKVHAIDIFMQVNAIRCTIGWQDRKSGSGLGYPLPPRLV